MNYLAVLLKLAQEITTSPMHHLIVFWRLKVEVIPWFKYLVAKSYTSTLGRRSLIFWFV